MASYPLYQKWTESRDALLAALQLREELAQATILRQTPDPRRMRH